MGTRLASHALVFSYVYSQLESEGRKVRKREGWNQLLVFTESMQARPWEER